MYIDANGNHFESYEHACWHYGADTPDMLAAEEAHYWFEEMDELMDGMEARCGPQFGLFADEEMEIPF